jgi:hypothetical protein
MLLSYVRIACQEVIRQSAEEVRESLHTTEVCDKKRSRVVTLLNGVVKLKDQAKDIFEL